MKKFLSTFPAWTASIIWFGVLIWLMAAPTPYMERVGDMIAGYDELCHIFMGAVMVGCLCVDWQRKHGWYALSAKQLVCCSLAGFFLSGILEVSQIWSPEEYRRWFEPMDLVWQAAGAAVMAIAYHYLQMSWATRQPD